MPPTQDISALQQDHDHLITLDGRVTNIEKRINGHVPERCIRTDEMLQQIMDDIKEIKDSNKWIWRTIAGAVVAGIIAEIITKIHF